MVVSQCTVRSRIVAGAYALRYCLLQLFAILLINVPALSFGLTLGWVSVESGAAREAGEAGEAREAGEDDIRVVAGAALTLAAAALGAPLAALALARGRKPTLIITSAGFLVSWLLVLCGGWSRLAGRVVAGVAGATAWAVAPILAREMCSAGVRGAAGGAVVAAHNLGMLVMYAAGDLQLCTNTVLWGCVLVSATHCALCTLLPESPAFLAASGKIKEAGVALSFLRGGRSEVSAELATLPKSAPPIAHISALRHMWRDHRTRRALTIACVAVAAQEMCGVLTLLQFAERVFLLAGAGAPGAAGGEGGAGAARRALLLGAVQLGGSMLALVLVERIGRRPLLVWSSTATCLSLGAAGACVWSGAAASATWLALAAAVLADSAGVQAAPYALLADMFPYETGESAVLLATTLAGAAAALETAVFPALASAAGLATALALATTLAGVYTIFVTLAVPETRALTPEQILDVISPEKLSSESCCTRV